jgi:hypothetical protein
MAAVAAKVDLLLLEPLVRLVARQVVVITQLVAGLVAVVAVETAALVAQAVLLLSILAELVLVHQCHTQELQFKSELAVGHMVAQQAVDTYMYLGHNNRKRIKCSFI